MKRSNRFLRRGDRESTCSGNGRTRIGAGLVAVLAAVAALAAAALAAPGAFAAPVGGDSPGPLSGVLGWWTADAEQRALGMLVAPYATDAEFAEWNPAAIQQGRFFDLSAPVSVEAANNAITGETLQALLTALITELRGQAGGSPEGGASWNQVLFEDLDRYTPEEGLRAGALGRAGLALGIWRVQADLSVIGVTDLALHRQAIDLLLRGELDSDAVYSFEDPASSTISAAYRDLRLALSIPIPFIPRLFGLHSFNIGAALHHLEGLGYAEASASGHVITEDGRVSGGDAHLSLRRATGGPGRALDLGIWAGLTRSISLSAGVTNLGVIRWEGVEQAEASVSEGNFPISPADLELEPLNEPYPWALPATGRVALAWQPLGILRLTGDYSRIDLFAGRPVDRFGAELWANPLLLMPVSIGASYSEPTGTVLRVGVGLNLGLMDLHLRLTNLQALLRGDDGDDRGKALGVGVLGGFRF